MKEDAEAPGRLNSHEQSMFQVSSQHEAVLPELSEQALSLVNVRAKAKRGRIFRAFQGVCGCTRMHVDGVFYLFGSSVQP